MDIGFTCENLIMPNFVCVAWRKWAKVQSDELLCLEINLAGESKFSDLIWLLFANLCALA